MTPNRTSRGVARCSFIVILFFATAGTPDSGPGPRNDSSLLPLLINELESFASHHGTTTGTLLGMLTRFNTQQEFVSKGGIGIIRPDVYIDATTNGNRILIEKTWTTFAASNGVSEVIVVAGGRVLDEVPLGSENASNLLLVLYTRTNVMFFDWKNGAAGSYARVSNP